MISFLMPAKDAIKYIDDSLIWLKDHKIEKPFEVIVIDDHSTDGTYQRLLELDVIYKELKVFKNVGKGKVDALNYAYSLSNGYFIKTFDADDIFNPIDIFEILIDHSYDVVIHNMMIVDEENKKISTYHVNPLYTSLPSNTVIENLISVPRCSFSFSRKIADKVFPLPLGIAYEDVWMSVVIKKFAKEIRYIDNEKVYRYRQHESQSFGGILNSSSKIFKIRSKNMLDAIDTIGRSEYFCNDVNFSRISLFYNYQLNGSFKDITCSYFTYAEKTKLIIMRFLPFLFKPVLKLKWFIDKFK